MKIRPYQLRLKNGQIREGLILQEGDRFGDVAPLPGFSRETLAEAREELEQGGKTLPSVRFALECLQHPLPALKVPINALNDFRPNFKALKVKVGHLSVEETIALVKKLPPCELRLDFNRAWTLPQLLALTSHFSPSDFAYFEEPTLHFQDLLAFSNLTGFPIAVDESIPYIPYAEIPTLKALVVKPTILGFIPTPSPGVELIFSSAFESGIGVAHIARLASIHNPTRPHGLDTYSHLLDDVLLPRPTISDGHFHFAGNASLC